MTIPLDDLTPYEPQKMPLTRHSDDCAQRGLASSLTAAMAGDTPSGLLFPQTATSTRRSCRLKPPDRTACPEWEADVFFTARDGWNDVHDA